MIRPLLAALLLLTGSPPAPAPAELEARRLALAVVRGPRGPFREALDTDQMLERRVGTRAWRGLTERQRAALREAARERFAGMLAPPPAVAADIAWTKPLSSGPASDEVALGVRFGEKTLKTKWTLRREGSSQWKIRDVVLADPGISLAEATLSTLGPVPVRRQDRIRRARNEVLPRLAALVAIGIAVLLAAPRVPVPRRRFLYFAAVFPAVFFAATAGIAGARIAGEPYAVGIAPAAEPWRRSQDLAVAAQREGRPAQARELWNLALAAGSPEGPSAYELGLAAKTRGDVETARAFFQRALAVASPAPGANRELATLALEAGRLAEAERDISSYMAAAGPDPDALSLQAVVKTNLGKPAEAVEAIAEARRLVGGGPKGAELEARIRARASDAAGAVSALRPLTEKGLSNRDELRRDPAYLPIATDPAWVSFLNEKVGVSEKSTVNSQQSTGSVR